MRGKIIKSLVLSSLSLGIFVGANAVTNGVSFNDNALAKSTAIVTHNKKSKSTAKKISAKFLKDSKVSKSGYIAKTHGAKIKLSTLKKYYGPSKFISDPVNQRVATTTSGNKIYWAKAHPQYATEVMPGIHDNSETFTNPTKHWVMYWINKATNANPIKYDNSKTFPGFQTQPDFSHKGFKPEYEQYDPINSEYPAFLGGKYGNFTGSALYSWHQKILLVCKKWYNYNGLGTISN